MKKLHDPVGNFYIPENKPCFWVRDIMHCSRLKIRQQDKGCAIFILPPSQNSHKTPYTAR